VELSLNGTHKGDLALPAGTIPATGKEIHAPCCDVFHIENGKVTSFPCYLAATIILAQLGLTLSDGDVVQRALTRHDTGHRLLLRPLRSTV